MATIKQTLDLDLNRFQIESEGSTEVWGRIYFDRYEIKKDLIQLYKVNKWIDAKGTPRETVTYIGGFAMENVQIIEKKEAEE